MNALVRISEVQPSIGIYKKGRSPTKVSHLECISAPVGATTMHETLCNGILVPTLMQTRFQGIVESRVRTSVVGQKQPSSFLRYDAERLLWSNNGRHLAVKKASIHWHSLTGTLDGIASPKTARLPKPRHPCWVVKYPQRRHSIFFTWPPSPKLSSTSTRRKS